MMVVFGLGWPRGFARRGGSVSETKETVLFVDDEPHTLALCERMFRQNYDVVTATGGKEALKLVADRDIALAVVDQRMPQMTGLDLLLELRSRFPDAGRMVMTGYAEIETVLALINDGKIASFIVKPWNNEQFRVSVEREVEYFRMNRKVQELTAEIAREHRTMKDLLGELDPDFAVPRTNEDLKRVKEQLRRCVYGAAERLFVEQLLTENPRNISTAARAANINRTFLYRLMRRHRIFVKGIDEENEA